ncbi:helix-turn-helix domain-containing protein [Deinococcus sp. QL22]|uniref:helix-turn-helix domain-containing protein n=1 Tax=Deinococcus sp. QL22 TaxID=2939437 RepID=UPI0020174A05|nr:helix-turn-helix domain-containing protein [Deinococcus sp. QL22]UQN08904.1 helix-turn-helix domain-containing protein [Deinococcus sp. QL22]
MTPPARHLSLSSEEDVALRRLELGAGINVKVRLRASIVRLNASGMTVPRLAQHFGRNPQSVHNDLDRYEQQGIPGLMDGRSSGPRRRITPELDQYLQERLAEQRLWNSDLLAEALQERFGITVSRDAVRVRLLALGYSWKRGRYAPGQVPDPDVIHEHQASIETLKKGHWTANSPSSF